MSQRERTDGDAASSAESNDRPESVQGGFSGPLSPVRRNTSPGNVPTLSYQDVGVLHPTYIIL